jgi:hypothetical protein
MPPNFLRIKKYLRYLPVVRGQRELTLPIGVVLDPGPVLELNPFVGGEVDLCGRELEGNLEPPSIALPYIVIVLVHLFLVVQQ